MTVSKCMEEICRMDMLISRLEKAEKTEDHKVIVNTDDMSKIIAVIERCKFLISRKEVKED